MMFRFALPYLCSFGIEEREREETQASNTKHTLNIYCPLSTHLMWWFCLHVSKNCFVSVCVGAYFVLGHHEFTDAGHHRHHHRFTILQTEYITSRVIWFSVYKNNVYVYIVFTTRYNPIGKGGKRKFCVYIYVCAIRWCTIVVWVCKIQNHRRKRDYMFASLHFC